MHSKMTQLSTSLCGLCVASLALHADSTRAVGCFEGTIDSALREEAWSQRQDLQQHRHDERVGLQNSRRRPRSPPLNEDGSNRNISDGPEHAGGLFNSFSLEENEPSSYYLSASTSSNSMISQRRHREGHDDEASFSAGGGSDADRDQAFDFDKHNQFSSADHTNPPRRNPQQRQEQHYWENSGEGAYAVEDCAAPDSGSSVDSHHYYPGRGIHAAQNLAQTQGLGRSPYTSSHNAPMSRYRRRNHPFFFNGGNPYGTSSSNGGTSLGASGSGGIRRRHQQHHQQQQPRWRRRQAVTSSSFSPEFPPAVAAAAATAVAALVKIMAAAGLALAVLTPLMAALSSHWAYFVAGGACSAIAHTATVPLDVIKTRIQCAPAGVEYRGTFDALVRICRSEGGRVLFCGAGATLVGYAMQGSLKFGFFEFLKPVFAGLFGRGQGGASATASAVSSASAPVLGALIAASVTAEIVGSSALTPLEAARIRMVADADYALGLRSGIARMISEEGVGSLTRGLPAVLAKQIPYTVTKLVTFDYLVRSVAARITKKGGGGGGSGGGRGLGITVVCAVIAGALSSLASQPGDSLLSALNSEGRSAAAGSRSSNSNSGMDAFNEMSYVSSEEEAGEDESFSSECDSGFGSSGSSSSSSSEEQADMMMSPSSAHVDGYRAGGGGEAGAVADVDLNAAALCGVDLEPVAHAMARIAREAGFLGLFRGTGARMIHVTSIVTVQLLIYQSIKRAVGIDK